MTRSNRLASSTAHAPTALTAELRRAEAEVGALQDRSQGIPPLTYDAAFVLLRRWLDVPLDSKPFCVHEEFLGDDCITASDHTGFFLWLITFLGKEFYLEVVEREPALASAFHTQFLDAATDDLQRWAKVSGPCYVHARFLQRGILELVDGVLGEGCQNEVISYGTGQ